MRWLMVALVVCAAAGATAARAAPSASLRVSLVPDKPGRETTISFAVGVLPGAGQRLPPALTRVELLYPSSIGIAVSGLGLATCSEATLELLGPGGCPAEAWMGVGSAVAAVPLGPEAVYEQTRASIVRAPEAGDRIAMYFNVEGDTPVLARLVLPGVLTSSGSGYESIDIRVPLVEGVVGGGDVSVVSLRATLGPRSLTYYEHTSRGYVPYKPRGILLPNRCPRRGFHFTVRLSFASGQSASAKAAVGCR